MAETVPPIGVKISMLAAEKPDAPALTCTGRTLTRRELDLSTNRLARDFAERGVGQDDYVTIALPNSIEFLQAAIAAWKLGAVPQPLPARLPDNEFQGLLDLRHRALIVGRADPSGKVPNVESGYTPDPGVSDAPLPEAVSPARQAIASGGSTGRPKLIESGGTGRANLTPLGLAMGSKEEDVQLISVPMTHNTGMITASIGLVMGHHLVLMPKFDPAEFLRLVGENSVNWLVTVPTIMHRLLPVYDANPQSYDLSSLRRFWHVGAPCAPSVKDRWIELLGPDRVWELYGGAEIQALTALSGGEWLAHRGSVGRVITGEMKVLHDDGNECPPGTSGEVYMRPTPGAPATYRYIGATAKSRDGWDSLGDLGYFDEDGYLYLDDRRVDMFTVGGRNVYPAEIEGALCAHPDVLSCLVVGVPDDDMGQLPYALVQADNLDQAGVIDFLTDRIAGYKVPRTVEFVDHPLRDDAGKARRTAVRDEVIARLARASS